jgi:hypothetical protein
MTCHDSLPGLPAVSSLMPLHQRLRNTELSRDPNNGHWIGTIHDGLRILEASIDALTDEQRSALCTSMEKSK